jgi:hypothetical protein
MKITDLIAQFDIVREQYGTWSAPSMLRTGYSQ